MINFLRFKIYHRDDENLIQMRSFKRDDIIERDDII